MADKQVPTRRVIWSGKEPPEPAPPSNKKLYDPSTLNFAADSLLKMAAGIDLSQPKNFEARSRQLRAAAKMLRRQASKQGRRKAARR